MAKYPNEKVEEIIKLHSEGKSPFEIAKLFNTYNTTIRRILLKNGIKLKNQSESQVSITKNPFENYQTDEVAAYWLGYLIADGNISTGKGGFRVIINTNKDPEHLQQYADYVGKPLRKYLNKTYKVWEYSVVFYNKKIVNWLIDLGITPNKSLNFKFKGELNNHIIRGVFDGDGCVHADGRIGFTIGSEKFKNQIKNYLESIKFNVKVYYDKRGNGCWGVYVLNQTKFYNFIYLDSNIAMQRKKHLLGQLISNDW